MPSTLNLPDTRIHAMRRLAVAMLAYAVGVAIVASCVLPTLLSADPVARLLPKASTAVARLPQAASQPFARAAL